MSKAATMPARAVAASWLFWAFDLDDPRHKSHEELRDSLEALIKQERERGANELAESIVARGLTMTPTAPIQESATAAVPQGPGRRQGA